MQHPQQQHTIVRGVGSDIVEICRIREAIKIYGHSFYKRVLTPLELEYCLSHKDPAIPAAGRFSAKEALSKALGTGLGRSLSFLDIEILNDERGCPIATLSDASNDAFNAPSILLSISHCKEYATATAIWLSEE